VYFSPTPRDRYFPKISYPFTTHPNHIRSAVSLTLHRTLTKATKQKSLEDKAILLADGQTLLTAFWHKFKRRHAARQGHIFKRAILIRAMEIDQWLIPIPMPGYAEG
jgi:hypothetical protein